MILGSLCTQLYFNSPVLGNQFNNLELQKVVYDEVKLDEEKLNFTTEKVDWGYNTVAYSKFQNTISAGNLSDNGIKVTHLKLRKRKLNELKWHDIVAIPFETNKQSYELSDSMVEPLEEYSYQLYPISEGGVLGSPTTATIEADFEGIWVIGKDEKYQFKYGLNSNMELGQIETVQKSAVIETIGSKYPFIFDNGAVNYKKTNVKALLVSKNTLNHSSDEQIDRRAEKQLRQSIHSFLTDKKPKIFKDSSGNYMLVRIVDTPVLIPSNELNQQVYEVTFNVVEIGDVYNDDTLRAYGFIE